MKCYMSLAIELKNQDQYDEAAGLLCVVAESHTESASVHALLADVFWEKGDLEKAVLSFRRAVELSPTSEMASLGLFHTLWESKDKPGAVSEMHRFLSVSKSEEYAGIAKELDLLKISDID